MATTPYQPVSFTSESLTQAKLQQMTNNDQWLFENSPRLRYSSGGIIRDTGVKIISGKAVYPAQTADFVNVYVYFGSFFSASCKPIITATPEPHTNRVSVALSSLTFGAELDNRGFRAHVYSVYGVQPVFGPLDGGWLHWTAIGY